MKLTRLQRHWDEFGRRDPLWAILTRPEKKGNLWEVEEFFQTGREEIAALMGYIASLERQVPRRRALDFGCGAGRLTQALADYFEEVVGIDIASSMLDLARKYNRHGERCRFVLNDADDLHAFPANTFDLVYSRLVLQHMRPRHVRAYVPELIRVLVPGGLLIFQLPAGDEPPVVGSGVKRYLPLSMIKLLRRARRIVAAFPRMDIYGMSPDVMTALLRRHGAIIVDITPDRGHGDDTRGFRYCVTKPA